ncbi:hypothetical protein B4Q13_17225 [Lacticaseibacillus rhamnosus]
MPKGAIVADVTFGQGVFWKNVRAGDYKLLASDIDAKDGHGVFPSKPIQVQNGIDCRSLPDRDESLDGVVDLRVFLVVRHVALQPLVVDLDVIDVAMIDQRAFVERRIHHLVIHALALAPAVIGFQPRLADDGVQIVRRQQIDRGDFRQRFRQLVLRGFLEGGIDPGDPSRQGTPSPSVLERLGLVTEKRRIEAVVTSLDEKKRGDEVYDHGTYWEVLEYIGPGKPVGPQGHRSYTYRAQRFV